VSFREAWAIILVRSIAANIKVFFFSLPDTVDIVKVLLIFFSPSLFSIAVDIKVLLFFSDEFT
jgi:hypothetical protein